MSPPTGVAANQSCVPDPTPVRRTGTTLNTSAGAGDR
jgi:hypothetical protein